VYLDPKSDFWGRVQTEDPQTEPFGVVIWDSTFPDVTHAHGWGGHVSEHFGDTAWSWESGGWSIERWGYYLGENTYRSGTEYVLDGGPEWNKRMTQGIQHGYDDYGFDGPLFGPYHLLSNNCGEGFCRTINRMGGLPRDIGLSPAQHRQYVEDNLKDYVKERIYIPRSDVETAPEYLRFPLP
jgi:hypothetical protein